MKSKSSCNEGTITGWQSVTPEYFFSLPLKIKEIKKNNLAMEMLLSYKIKYRLMHFNTVCATALVWYDKYPRVPDVS